MEGDASGANRRVARSPRGRAGVRPAPRRSPGGTARARIRPHAPRNLPAAAHLAAHREQRWRPPPIESRGRSRRRHPGPFGLAPFDRLRQLLLRRRVRGRVAPGNARRRGPRSAGGSPPDASARDPSALGPVRRRVARPLRGQPRERRRRRASSRGRALRAAPDLLQSGGRAHPALRLDAAHRVGRAPARNERPESGHDEQLHESRSRRPLAGRAGRALPRERGAIWPPPRGRCSSSAPTTSRRSPGAPTPPSSTSGAAAVSRQPTSRP